MAKRNKPFPLSLIVIAVLLLIIYFMNDGTWGPGTTSNNTGETENSLEDTGTVNQKPPVITNQVVEEDSIAIPVDTIKHEITELKDTIPVIEATDTTTLLTVNTILVTKRNDSLFYKINEQTYINLLQGIAETDYTLPFNIKLAGNLTYADEREIKDILEEKDINFNIEE